MPQGKTVVVVTRLTPEMAKRFAEICKEKDVYQSEVLRKMIARFNLRNTK